MILRGNKSENSLILDKRTILINAAELMPNNTYSRLHFIFILTAQNIFVAISVEKLAKIILVFKSYKITIIII